MKDVYNMFMMIQFFLLRGGHKRFLPMTKKIILLRVVQEGFAGFVGNVIEVIKSVYKINITTITPIRNSKYAQKAMLCDFIYVDRI